MCDPHFLLTQLVCSGVCCTVLVLLFTLQNATANRKVNSTFAFRQFVILEKFYHLIFCKFKMSVPCYRRRAIMPVDEDLLFEFKVKFKYIQKSKL
jgi:hypothetical protein